MPFFPSFILFGKVYWISFKKIAYKKKFLWKFSHFLPILPIPNIQFQINHIQAHPIQFNSRKILKCTSRIFARGACFFLCHHNFALCTELSMPLTLFKYINNKVRTGRLSSPSTTGIWKINSIRFDSISFTALVLAHTVTQNGIRRRSIYLFIRIVSKWVIVEHQVYFYLLIQREHQALTLDERDHSMKLNSNAINVECLFLEEFFAIYFSKSLIRSICTAVSAIAVSCRFDCAQIILFQMIHFTHKLIVLQ